MVFAGAIVAWRRALSFRCFLLVVLVVVVPVLQGGFMSLPALELLSLLSAAAAAAAEWRPERWYRFGTGIAASACHAVCSNLLLAAAHPAAARAHSIDADIESQEIGKSQKKLGDHWRFEDVCVSTLARVLEVYQNVRLYVHVTYSK